MKHEDAIELIRDGVPPAGVWADLGAGTGTFTRALGELLGADGVVHAIDRDAEAVLELARVDLPGGGILHARRADFTDPIELPTLDGVLMANALHFLQDQPAQLQRITTWLRPGGRLLLVEYDRDRGNRWVPHPVPLRRFRELAAQVGLSEPCEVGRRASAYWREMYAAVAHKR